MKKAKKLSDILIDYYNKTRELEEEIEDTTRVHNEGVIMQTHNINALRKELEVHRMMTKKVFELCRSIKQMHVLNPFQIKYTAETLRQEYEKHGISF